jgi:hypothetical protein
VGDIGCVRLRGEPSGESQCGGAFGRIADSREHRHLSSIVLRILQDDLRFAQVTVAQGRRVIGAVTRSRLAHFAQPQNVLLLRPVDRMASGMMIRSARVPWRSDDDDPPPSRPLYIASVVLVVTWAVVLTMLLAGLARRVL